MRSKILLMMFVVLIWTGTVHGQNPPVVAIKAESLSVAWNAGGVHGQADPGAVIPAVSTARSEDFRNRQAGPLPATIAVLLAGVLTAVIMQTKR